MNADFFNRLKKLAKKEGKVVFADNDDAFVILPFGEYEMLTDGLYGEECDCDDENCDCHHDHDFDKDFNFSEEILMDNEDAGKPAEVKKEDDEADKDLIKRVNEDIARWRAEQQNQENIETKKHGSIKEEKATEQKKEDVLTEEERYYLEPLE